MAVGCGSKVAKILLVIFNVLFLLAGGAIIASGVWCIMTSGEMFKEFGTQLGVDLNIVNMLVKVVGYIVIGIGAFVFLVSFLGCCGALCENKCMLGCYLYFVIVVTLCVAAAAIGGFTGLRTAMKEAAEHSVDRFNKDELVERTELNTTEPVGGVAYTYTAYARGLMATQYRLDCCGINGPSDYNRGKPLNKYMEMLPTCCKMNIPFLTAPKFNTSYPRPEHAEDWSKCVHEFHAVRSANDATSITTTHLHTKGCVKELMDNLNKIKVALITDVVIVGLEVLCIILAILLCCNVDKPEESSY